ncbi:sister chromatid cohesion protein PDS5 homolog C-like isoform X1 [Trifolium pratense]|uniref:sister chromatid cohesion protein PDS5 homolog C-like isoform X1 n=1 Tax=Trifolium pratense TaxID=57577 RepID=UPI001E697945|nr:sister chromatid cohesion protein PDS5 homolog C-like isoform X1 [Trifolium pratense]XP_045822866.1 sister chromatid cohesion protein PDS5 homolog C-like isoform X1 [Trifolium pratense]
MASANKELEEELLEAGNKLFDPPSSIEDLLLLLFKVGRCLRRVEQLPTESMQNALSPSLKALVDDKLMRHSDVDVKVAVTSCLIELTRITAPDAPYNDHQMMEVFRLIVFSFENLHDKSSRWYEERIWILEVFEKIRLFEVMLDLQCDALIFEMFQNFFKTIMEYHPDKVFSFMKTIMVFVLEEGGLSDDTALDLLSPIMDSLDNGNEVVLPIARKLAESVLQKCPAQLTTYSRRIAILSLAHSRTATAA